MSARKVVALSFVIWGGLGLSAPADASPTTDGWSIYRADGSTISNGPGSSFNPGTGSGGHWAGSQGGSGGGGTADAFLNFDAAPIPGATPSTVGSEQPWYESPSILKAYGHVPDAGQQGDFERAVLADVQATFRQGGLSPSLTLDPGTTANHTLSVVSGLSFGGNSSAIGITDVGHNGLSFLDKLDYATNPNDLEWAVAHNIAHELMHAFGVSQHDDSTGQYLDTATATWNLLTNPGTKFSAQALTDINNSHFGNSPSGGGSSGEMMVDGDEILVQPVPEPATLALWTLALAGLALGRRRLDPRASA